MAFRKYQTPAETASTAGVRAVPAHPLQARLIRLLDRYRASYDAEDLEDYQAVLHPLAPVTEDDMRQACRAWMADAMNTRAPHPGELKALIEAQRRQAQPQTLESWQQPAPPRLTREELQAILAGLKPSLR
jgi:hypothetical protein